MNRAFLYGDGLFETIKVSNNQLLYWEKHWQRLLFGCDVIGLIPPEKEKVLSVCQSLIEEQAYSTARLRISVFRSGGGFYTPESDSSEFFVQIQPIEQKNISPLRLGIFSQYPSPNRGFKSINALEYVAAARFAKQNQLDDAILLSKDQYISETSRANLIFKIDNQLFSPDFQTGCVRGVLLSHLREHIKISPIQLKISELEFVQNIYCTNVILGVLPVVQIGNHHFSRDLFLEEDLSSKK